MDEIETRLRDVSDACVKAYLNWQGKKRDPESREALQDTIHELRKVSARLEIEIAVSERDEMASRPIPIPPHRATRKGAQGDDEGDNAGNFVDHGASAQGHGGGQPRPPLRRRSQHQGGRPQGRNEE
jgi:hypothetical protein